MSEQALDLRRSAQILRWHKILVGIVLILGALAGGVYAIKNPPLLTSTALVILPQSAQAQQGAAVIIDGAADPYTLTQQVIMTSNTVLHGAAPQVRPAMSVDKLRRDISVGILTPYVISVSAKGKVAADAEATANAVVRSYLSYVDSASSPIGRVPAQLLEPATSATAAPLVPLLVDALAGAVAGLLIGVIIALAIGRNDRRLRERDQIADSIGVPVLASVSVAQPSNAAAWMKLLADYAPGAVDAWQLRKALHQLGLMGMSSSDPRADGFSLAVLSLSTDRKALALGPQLAALAAAVGIPTALVIGPAQDANTAATLRAACAAAATGATGAKRAKGAKGAKGTAGAAGAGSGPPNRSRQLRVAVRDDPHVGELPGAALTVVVAVVDGKAPRVADTMRTTATMLGVSASTVTAEQLARVAVSAAVDGREIAGILVADPDPADRTTGRAPQVARPGLRRMPTRMTGAATEIRQ
jgi:capsular polysaccharide biosynthesis protein